VRLIPDIRYGTEAYPEKVTRRLRAVNFTVWCSAAFVAMYAVVQCFDPTPGIWKLAAANGVTAMLLVMLPLLHRFGPVAAPLGFSIISYAAIFIICGMIGTASGISIQYLAVGAVLLLFFGSGRIGLAVLFGALAPALMLALEFSVPRDTGLVPPAMLLTYFIACIVGTCITLFAVVFYAVREIDRAEASAEREFERSETLLANILPAKIADRLKNRDEGVIADKYDDTSVLFADMAGYTASASDTDPADLVQFLNRVFSDFDRLVERHHLEKIKTTGDSYMVVSGVPVPRADHAEALADLALAMRDAAADLRDPHGRSVAIRIGISTGPVVAGVVGTSKFFYDVWGDAVNVAARMESTGVPGQIQVSETSYDRLAKDFVLEPRGTLDIKGKGRMSTWLLVGRKSADEPAISAPLAETGVAG
jgi:adenylate cyclase